MEIELLKLNIVPPYNFDFALTHYNIYPWISEEERLIRVLRLQNGKKYVAEIKSLGTVDNPKLVIRIEPLKNVTPQEVKEIKETISWCLGLKEDYRPFYEMCENDRVLKTAMEARYGSKGKSYPTVFEAIIGVICAQNIQFKRLYSMMYNLCTNFGELLEVNGKNYFSFPPPESISKASLSSLRGCKVGYRDKFIKGVAGTIVKDNINLENLKKLSTDEAREALLKLPGIGLYTVNLVLSVGLRKKDILHLDRFVREAMYTFYFDGEKVSDDMLIEYANQHWHGFQSLAVDALTTNTEIWAKKLGVDFKFKSGAKGK